jgi:hypothetical protein
VSLAGAQVVLKWPGTEQAFLRSSQSSALITFFLTPYFPRKKAKCNRSGLKTVLATKM